MNPEPVPAAAPPASPAARAAVWLLLLAACLAHFHLVTRNWTAGFMPGHEFRQTHTAIIARHIDREDNFRPIYTVPLFGKPWVCPMEFPLYEWSVVGLSRVTHWPHHVAARTVSLLCFYLTLPAVWWLLALAGLRAWQRVIPLVLTLCCPVYIFYSRSFLMESMTLLGGVWFLALFVQTMRERRLHWALLAAVAGTASGLVKSTTFFIWLLAGAAYGGWCLWRAWRADARRREVARVLAWGIGTASAPCAAVWWWVKYSDTFKVDHPSAHIFASKALSQGNFGLTDWTARFSPETWGTLFERWGEAIAPAWLVGLVIAGGLALARGWRARILAAFAIFLSPQLLFPFAYAYQEYYFYACGVAGLAALGFVVVALLESRLPRWLKPVLALALPAALLGNYDRVYREIQNVPSPGGTGLTAALRAFTPPDSVLVVIGDDWAPIVPYYADRKALMVRRGLESDWDYLKRAFGDLQGEQIGALVMMREQRANAGLVRRIAAELGLDATPTFSHPTADVYLPGADRDAALVLLHASLRGGGAFEGITTTTSPPALSPGAETELRLTPAIAAGAFAMVRPVPVRFRASFGYVQWNYGPDVVLSVHPDADLWVPLPPGARAIEWEFGILHTAYERDGQRTNGVEFSVSAESGDGSRRELFRRVLDPASSIADRGVQRAEIPLVGATGETLVFSTRSQGDLGFDWAFTRRIEIR